jgi:hypothetical protein
MGARKAGGKGGGKKTSGKGIPPERLSRRFIRHREAGPERPGDWSARVDGCWEVDWDACWNCRDPRYDGIGVEAARYAAATWRHQVSQLVRELQQPSRPLLPPGLVGNPEETPLVRAGAKSRAPAGLEARLSSHLALIAGLGGPREGLGRSISGSLGDGSRITQIVKFLERKGVSKELAGNLILFAPYWVKDPFAWDGRSGEVGLVRHLLARYDVPGFLEEEWSNQFEVPRLKWQCWYILIGQGGSIRRAAGHFQWSIGERFQRHLWEAPEGCSPLEACLFAEVRRAGGSGEDFRAILQHPGLVFDPTEPGVSGSYLAFWQDLIKWLKASRVDALTEPEKYSILSWATHSHMAAEAGARTRKFRLGAMGARAALRRALEFHSRVSNPEDDYRWRGRGLDWRAGDSPDDWEITELRSKQELQEESEHMDHCVVDYAARCVLGVSAIFSMRKGGQRHLTVEVNPFGMVVQARGFANRSPTPEEMKVLEEWPVPLPNTPSGR